MIDHDQPLSLDNIESTGFEHAPNDPKLKAFSACQAKTLMLLCFSSFE
jgi:hypothetical protein